MHVHSLWGSLSVFFLLISFSSYIRLCFYEYEDKLDKQGLEVQAASVLKPINMIVNMDT